VEITFHGLDSIFAMAAGAVQVLVQPLRRRGCQGGHDKTRGLASRPDFGFEPHAPGAGPRRRSIAEVIIEATPGREPLAIGLRRRGALLL
jgi:hypothetical protein